jgi:hypothetical protein
VIHLYALARREPPTPVRGIDDVEVVFLPVDDLLAVVSHHREALEASDVVALAHVSAIEAVAAHVEVLPVRFGPGHGDDETLRGRLRPQLPELRQRLDRVGGTVEFVIRPLVTPPVTVPDDGVEPAASGSGRGRAYLERRRDLERARAAEHDAVRARLIDASRPLVAEALAVHDTVGPRGPERCLLIARAAAPAFAVRARQLVAEVDLVVGGPWPAFTFAALPSAAEVPR